MAAQRMRTSAGCKLPTIGNGKEGRKIYPTIPTSNTAATIFMSTKVPAASPASAAGAARRCISLTLRGESPALAFPEGPVSLGACRWPGGGCASGGGGRRGGTGTWGLREALGAAAAAAGEGAAGAKAMPAMEDRRAAVLCLRRCSMQAAGFQSSRWVCWLS